MFLHLALFVHDFLTFRADHLVLIIIAKFVLSGGGYIIYVLHMFYGLAFCAA